MLLRATPDWLARSAPCSTSLVPAFMVSIDAWIAIWMSLIRSPISFVALVERSARLLPRELQLAHKDDPKTLPRVPGGHYQDWLRACKDRTLQTGANFDYAAHLSEICMLGNLAKRVNGRIEWDAAAMRVTNNEEANAFIAPAYRDGWTL